MPITECMNKQQEMNWSITQYIERQTKKMQNKNKPDDIKLKFSLSFSNLTNNQNNHHHHSSLGLQSDGLA